MEEIKLTPEELKQAIDFGKLIGSGFFSSVFTYKGRLIKFLQKNNSENRFHCLHYRDSEKIYKRTACLDRDVAFRHRTSFVRLIMRNILAALSFMDIHPIISRPGCLIQLLVYSAYSPLL